MVESSKHIMHDKESTEAWLSSNGIDFHTVQHEQVSKVQDMLEKIKFEGAFAEAKFAKHVFLANKKKKDVQFKEHMWLVVAAHDTPFGNKDLEKLWKTGSGNLRGDCISAELMDDLIGTKAGAINLFSIVNDKEKHINLVIDKRLLEEFEYVSFHPMDNHYSTAIKKDDLKKIIELCGHEASIQDFSQIAAPVAAAPKKPQNQKAKKEPKEQKPQEKAKKREDVHRLHIRYFKETNFSEWYQQVITKSEMIEYYEISGCYILRPLSFYIWEQIQAFIDARIKTLGVQNCYFPMFVSQAALKKEEKHLEGFSPEVAWVTKSGDSDLNEPIAIRPTSETIMYPAFAKWIQSHRDLPMLMNQWTNVVRWEFKHPMPFIRTREFLWQEGHTVHETEKDMEEFILKILDIYAATYEELLACPVIKGRKSEDERFAGADNTTTCELYVPVSGRGIQGATSHMLGQNFSKMFDVDFLDEHNEKKLAWQGSWGLSTRSIGTMIMIHSDNDGLVLPPKIAQIQVVIVPIVQNETKAKILERAQEIKNILSAAGIRTHVDERDNHNPGFKFNHWELRGVPICIHLGKDEVEQDKVTISLRYEGTGKNSPTHEMKMEGLAEQMHASMVDIHNAMFNKAKKSRDENLDNVKNWDSFMNCLNHRKICLAPWCDTVACEEAIKARSKEESLAAMEAANEGEVLLTGAAKTLCIPYELGKQDFSQEPECCFHCGKPAAVTALWGRSY